MNFELNNLLPLIVNFPLFMAMLLIIVRHKITNYIITIFTTFIVLLISVFLLVNIDLLDSLHYYFGNFLSPFGIEYRVELLNLFFIFLLSLVAFIVSIYNLKPTLLEINNKKYYLFNVIFLLCYTGLLGILTTNDAFNLFVFLEISSLSSYILISMNRNKHALLASFNYLIIGSIGASFYVFGIGILYAFYGTLNISTLTYAIENASTIPAAVNVSFLLIIIGILIKIALFPMFLWAPNVYNFSPFTASAFLASVSGKVAIYVFIKIVLIFLSVTSFFNMHTILNAISILAVFSMFIGGYLAFKQDNLKKLFAFSSLAQVGFIMFALSLNTVDAMSVALFLVFTHALIKLGLFLIAGIINIKFGSYNLNDLSGHAIKSKFIFFMLVFFMLSLASIPGTAMFIAKFNLILATINNQNYIFSVLIILASILSFLYSFKVIYKFWYRPKNLQDIDENLIVHKAPFYSILAVIIVFIINVAIIIYPDFLINITNYIAFSTINSNIK
jgi:multicomponent Na+:H+ antiporter subunit D